MSDSSSSLNRYARIIEHIFFDHYTPGSQEVVFNREEIRTAARDLKITIPSNIGDIIYSFRYRVPLPASVQATAPGGMTWIIRPAGHALYKFVPTILAQIVPTAGKVATKIPDATPGIIAKYSKSDEQALLAKVRYNRLIDVFTGVTCYSLQNHLRTTVPDVGQVETDELYIGVDRRGAHYLFPVQAKGGSDILSVVQIEQDFALGAAKFPELICRPIAAQFIADDLIALFDFELEAGAVRIASESHYRLVRPDQLSDAELRLYRSRPIA